MNPVVAEGMNGARPTFHEAGEVGGGISLGVVPSPAVERDQDDGGRQIPWRRRQDTGGASGHQGQEEEREDSESSHGLGVYRLVRDSPTGAARAGVALALLRLRHAKRPRNS